MNMTPEEERDVLVDRYVNGKLSAEECAAFEIRMMDDAALLEQMQMAAALKAGLRMFPQLSLAATANQDQPPAHTAERVNVRKIPSFGLWLRQPLSLAASLLIAMLGVQTIYTGFNAFDDADDGVLAIGTVMLLESSRGDVPLQFSGPPPYLLQIDAGFGNESETFDVIFKNAETGELLIEQRNLRPDSNGWLRLVVRQNLGGTISGALIPSGRQEAGPAVEFEINVAR